MFWNPNGNFVRSVATLCAAALISGSWPVSAQQQAPPDGSAPPQDAPLMAPDQLESLVAPIALYPDPLIAQILAAATYPLEVVEASRWLQNNPNLREQALTDAARDQNWDPSVQAMVAFPSVVKMMDQNLRWTTDLGNAFLAQEQDVMEAIQRQRGKAQQSGKLVSNEQQRVEIDQQDNRQTIVIEPAQPEVIYVPVYDPYAVWGPPVYPYYRNFWYPPRSAYGALVVGGIFGFAIGVSIGHYYSHWGGWNNWGWGMGWRNRTVVVNNNFYVRNNYRGPVGGFRDGRSNWVHDSQHRVGVPYPNRQVVNRVGGPMNRDSRPFSRPQMRDSSPGGFRQADRPMQQQQQRDSRPMDRQQQQQQQRDSRPMDRQQRTPDMRQSNPGREQVDHSRDRTALGGVGDSGSRTRIESDRGHGSLDNARRPAMQSAPAAQPQRQAQPTERQAQPAQRQESHQGPARESRQGGGGGGERKRQ